MIATVLKARPSRPFVPGASLKWQFFPLLRIEEGTGRHTVSGIAPGYHAAILAAIDPALGAQDGIGRLIRAHLDWVVNNRREARYLFEISRSEWTEEVRDAQRTRNSRLADGIEGWRAPLIARGELLPKSGTLFLSQIIGPAQIFCRAWLSGRDRSDPRLHGEALIACAIRALDASDAIAKAGATP